MDIHSKPFNTFWSLCDKNSRFKGIVFLGTKNNKIRFFNDIDYETMQNLKIKSKAFKVSTLKEWFENGYNILYPKRTAYLLSLLQDNVDIVSGTIEYLNDESYYWLETKKELIDPKLMIVVDKSYVDSLNYNESNRVLYSQLIRDSKYKKAKEGILCESQKSK